MGAGSRLAQQMRGSVGENEAALPVLVALCLSLQMSVFYDDVVQASPWHDEESVLMCSSVLGSCPAVLWAKP